MAGCKFYKTNIALSLFHHQAGCTQPILVPLFRQLFSPLFKIVHLGKMIFPRTIQKQNRHTVLSEGLKPNSNQDWWGRDWLLFGEVIKTLAGWAKWIKFNVGSWTPHGCGFSSWWERWKATLLFARMKKQLLGSPRPPEEGQAANMFSWGAPHTPSTTLTPPPYLVAAPLPKSCEQMNLLRSCSSARGALLNREAGGGETLCQSNSHD